MNRPAVIGLLMPVQATFLMFALLFSSCNDKTKGNASISGRIPGAGGVLLLLQELGLEYSTTLDSLTLDPEGNFSFKLNSNETGLYLLRFPNLLPLVLEIRPDDSIKISCQFGSFPSDVMISGSDNSRDLLGFFNASALNKKKYDSLENILISQQDEPGFAGLTRKLDESLKPVWENQRALEINYISGHLTSLTSLPVLNHGLSLSPVLTFHYDSVYFLRLDSALNKAFPGNKHADFNHKRIIQARESEFMKKHSK